MPHTVHQFAEKVAMISDASSPVGRAIAIQLALQGSYVIGVFPRGGSLQELVDLGTLAYAVEADPSTESGAAAAAAEAERSLGRVDLLVNCLKYRPKSSFEDNAGSDFVDTLAVNLGAVRFLTKAVMPLMRPRPKPKIVNVAWDFEGKDDLAFAAAQDGIISITRNLRDSLPRNFRVNCVQVTETAGTEVPGSEALFRPSGGVASDDVARVVLFLLSSESTAINGQVLRLG